VIFFNPIIILIITVILILIFKKKFLLSNSTGEKHQIFTSSKNIPLLGGILIFISLILDFNIHYVNFYIFCFLILILGILSDLKKISSPILRFLIQLIIIIIFIYILDININSIRINLIDNFLTNLYFNIFFASFCTLIILNGSNFIDGMNTSALGYYLIVSLTIKYLSLNEYNLNLYFNLDYFILVLIIFYFFNFFNKLYLGDNGAYLLGLIYSVSLINFYNYNANISPFFIVLLLWYPAFENLFSIIRKMNLKRSPIKPDTLHIHQLIYRFLTKNLLNNKENLSNTLTGNLINIYNLIIIFIGILDVNNSEHQIFLIIFNIIFYVVLYVRLLKIVK